MSMPNDLTNIYQAIASIGRRFGADRVVLYGSRARGDCRARSNIDIAVFGADTSTKSDFLDALEELPTLLDFDLVYVAKATDQALLDNINRDGVLLMDKLQEKYAKLVQAVARLEESIADYNRLQLDSVRDGVIQRFEFCTELSWKTVREYLLDQGYSNINSPKAVMKQAYADGLLEDEHGWLELLNARNLISHIYDEATAIEIFQGIRDTYAPLLRKLVDTLAQ